MSQTKTSQSSVIAILNDTRIQRKRIRGALMLIGLALISFQIFFIPRHHKLQLSITELDTQSEHVQVWRDQLADWSTDLKQAQVVIKLSSSRLVDQLKAGFQDLNLAMQENAELVAAPKEPETPFELPGRSASGRPDLRQSQIPEAKPGKTLALLLKEAGNDESKLHEVIRSHIILPTFKRANQQIAGLGNPSEKLKALMDAEKNVSMIEALGSQAVILQAERVTQKIQALRYDIPEGNQWYRTVSGKDQSVIAMTSSTLTNIEKAAQNVDVSARQIERALAINKEKLEAHKVELAEMKEQAESAIASLGSPVSMIGFDLMYVIDYFPLVLGVYFAMLLGWMALIESRYARVTALASRLTGDNELWQCYLADLGWLTNTGKRTLSSDMITLRPLCLGLLALIWLFGATNETTPTYVSTIALLSLLAGFVIRLRVNRELLATLHMHSTV